MLWILVAIGALIGALFAVRWWTAWRTAQAAKPKPRRVGVSFSTTESDIDDQFRNAVSLRPILVKDGLFWLACFLSLIMILLDIQFGVSRGGGSVAAMVILSSMFVAADLALPFFAVTGDKGSGSDWWRFDSKDRSYTSWTLIVICTVLSCIVVIGSTGEVSTTTGAQVNIAKVSYEQRLAQLAALQKEHDSIPTETQAPAALQTTADELGKAAEREGERGGCSVKCEALKKQAREAAARAANAKRKDTLRQQITAARADLEGKAGSARNDVDTLGTQFENLSGGLLPASVVQRDILTVIGLVVVLMTTLLWMVVGDRAQKELAIVAARAAGIADAMRNTAGLPLKYTVNGSPFAALPAPEATAKAGDTIVVNVAAEDMRRRYANDPELLETDRLFGSLLMDDETGAVTVADLYRSYRVAVLRERHDARYMTEATMVGKLRTIAQHRDDVSLTADGRIQGWRLRNADDLAKDAAQAAA
jgi:hypothetical protein